MEKENVTKLNKMMIERLIIMHNLIKSGVYPNVKQIKAHYLAQTGYKNIGEATIYRDIQTLRVNFGSPLEFDRQKNGYYYMDENWEFALNKISVKDVFYLSTAKTLLTHFASTPLYAEIAQVINFITDTQMEGKSSLINRIAITPTPKVLVNEENWHAIMQALQENAVLEFDYNGRWNKETTHRRVKPYQILLDNDMYFLFGFDENAKNEDTAQKGAERLFCINRIKNLKKLEEKFTLPKNFDFASRCSGGKFGAFIENKTETFKIEFYESAREYVKACIWEEDQKIEDDEKNDKTTITFNSSQSYKVLEWVLAQGSLAKPLAPPNFVAWWQAEIERMMANAKG